ncbi:VacJ family lipoprotein [Mesobacterium sp. TK19101]|uniref:VacJ family lipoprotein n=1 Tax=Mesobacterium hydrothermale TaxID=3111907 RepID=A0ABU6HBH2_9RHOB|nr:VacJ family lipoprotein [Mesobacterium sp. TK19101]MEC3859803.1 VacJ family lipoprotein [Mesobacterium sp. TK19101]
MTWTLPRLFAATALALSVAACSTPGPGQAPDGIWDPYETTNRRTHEFNKGLDRALVRPAGKGYATVVPDEVQDVVSNFADNLGTPASMVNQTLQGDVAGVMHNFFRFTINSTIGLLGLFDPATDMGLPERPSDFGQTLQVWGVPEGAYVELPLLGPSTERDTAGRVVDMFTNPLEYALPRPERYYGTATRVASKVGDRGRYSDTVDSILYESADSYAQARLIYLQNRRFELGEEAKDTYIDPYALDTEGF